MAEGLLHEQGLARVGVSLRPRCTEFRLVLFQAAVSVAGEDGRSY